jgi:hypothetical protein
MGVPGRVWREIFGQLGGIVTGAGLAGVLGWPVAAANARTLPIWPLFVFIGITVVGLVLMVTEARRRARENPDGVTIVDVHNTLTELMRGQGDNQELVASASNGDPELIGNVVMFRAAGTLAMAMGAGPVKIMPPPGEAATIPLPAGTRIEVTVPSASDTLRLHDEAGRPAGQP